MTWLAVFEENGIIETVPLKGKTLVDVFHQADIVLQGNLDEHPTLRLVVVERQPS